MTTYDYRSSAPPQAGGQDSGVKDQARQAAETATDEGKHVAGVAKDEARSVAADAQEQARDLLADARNQLEDQSRTQLKSLVSTLQSFAGDLERMARGEGAGSGLARDMVTQVSEKARGISSQLQGREPSEVLDQARDFARRRPGTFLLGALAAGVVAGRLARGAKDAGSTEGSTGTSTSTSSPVASTTTATPGAAPSTPYTPSTPTADSGTAAGEPLAGTPPPVEPPVYPEGTESTPGGAL